MNEKNEQRERIAKVIARAGLASRREAEAWIVAGRVAVNGEVTRSPAYDVSVHDRISIDGDPLPARQRTRLFLYHKPRGLVTAHADPQGRPTIFANLPAGLPRLISIGRLDFNTEGLLLLTNDGGLARELELPATGWLRRYRVRTHGSVTQPELDQLRAGVTIERIHYRSIEATIERVQGTNLWLSFAVREGKNREVRKVLGHLGLTVARLIRISFGPFQLGDLGLGAVEEVPTRILHAQLGERLAALSGADFSAPIFPVRREKKTNEKRDRRELRADEHQTRSHSWRATDDELPAKRLRRRFHGRRHDAEAQRARPTDSTSSAPIVDRKGRRVEVDRLGATQAAMQPPRTAPRKHVAQHGRPRRR